jgi:hypothetical protein
MNTIQFNAGLEAFSSSLSYFPSYSVGFLSSDAQRTIQQVAMNSEIHRSFRKGLELSILDNCLGELAGHANRHRGHSMSHRSRRHNKVLVLYCGIPVKYQNT